jgi:hypothetical protein
MLRKKTSGVANGPSHHLSSARQPVRLLTAALFYVDLVLLLGV